MAMDAELLSQTYRDSYLLYPSLDTTVSLLEAHHRAMVVLFLWHRREFFLPQASNFTNACQPLVLRYGFLPYLISMLLVAGGAGGMVAHLDCVPISKCLPCGRFHWP